jgi:hypothetical protein
MMYYTKYLTDVNNLVKHHLPFGERSDFERSEKSG